MQFLSLDDMVEATNIDMDEGRNKGFKVCAYYIDASFHDC